MFLYGAVYNSKIVELFFFASNDKQLTIASRLSPRSPSTTGRVREEGALSLSPENPSVEK